MKQSLFSVKSKRNKIFAAITVVGVLLLFGLNLLLTYFGLKDTVFFDITKEGFYTLTDKMVEQCEFIEDLKDEDGNPKPIEITFCADPDSLMSYTLTRVTYVMALKLQREFDNVKVKTVNVAIDPTAVASYKTTSMTQITSTDVIVSYGGKYRIAAADSFWTTSNGALWSYNGEYKMASIFMSLTAINQPAAYFVTGHGETVYDPENPESAQSIKAAALADLLTERGFAIKVVNISELEDRRIPDDCALLIINNPRTDFTYDEDAIDEIDYVSDLEVIDRYLTKGNGALMVAKDYAERLEMLEAFLYEWGFEFSDTKVKDEGNSLPTSTQDQFPPIIGVYETDEDSYGNAIYGDYASTVSSPRMIFTNTGYITTSFGLAGSMVEGGADNVLRRYDSFINTSAGAVAYAYNADKGGYTDPAINKSTLALAAVCSRQLTDSYAAKTTYSYVFCANSPEFFSNEIIGNHSYANFDIVSSLVNNIARTEHYASSDLGGISLNSSSFGGKQIINPAMYDHETKIYSPDASKVVKVNAALDQSTVVVFSVLVYAVPVAIAAIGIAVCVRRKFL